MNLKHFRTDTNAEEQGKWFDLDGAQFLIGANLNKRHRRVYQKIDKAHSRALQRKDQATADALMTAALVDGLLYDWKGVKDGETEIPFSRETAIKILTEYRMIRDFVAECAMSLSNFATGEEDAQEGTLKSGSPVEPSVGQGC